MGTRASPWAESLEDWFAHETLSLISPTQVITRHEDGHKDAVLDLVLVNLTASWSDQFSFQDVSFSKSLGSDHALLMFTWSPELYIPDSIPSSPIRWRVHDSLRDIWIDHFKSLPIPQTFLTPEDVRAEALLLTSHITDTNDWCFDRQTTGSPKGSRWWDDGCTYALSELQKLSHGVERRHAYQLLRTAVRQAKRAWSEKVLTDATNCDKDLWTVAKWRKGRHTSGKRLFS
jgi:hypothetical protein